MKTVFGLLFYFWFLIWNGPFLLPPTLTPIAVVRPPGLSDDWFPPTTRETPSSISPLSLAARPLPLPALRRLSRACCAWPTCSLHHPHQLPPACRPGGLGARTEAVGAPAVGWAQCLAVLLPSAPQGSGPSSGQHTGEPRARRRKRMPVWMNRTAWEHASRMQSIVRAAKHLGPGQKCSP